MKFLVKEERGILPDVCKFIRREWGCAFESLVLLLIQWPAKRSLNVHKNMKLIFQKRLVSWLPMMCKQSIRYRRVRPAFWMAMLSLVRGEVLRRPWAFKITNTISCYLTARAKITARRKEYDEKTRDLILKCTEPCHAANACE